MMAQRKSITKAVSKKPAVKTEKSKRLSNKQPTKVVTSKRPTSSSKGKQVISTQKNKSIKKPVSKARLKVEMANNLPCDSIIKDSLDSINNILRFINCRISKNKSIDIDHQLNLVLKHFLVLFIIINETKDKTLKLHYKAIEKNLREIFKLLLKSKRRIYVKSNYELENNASTEVYFNIDTDGSLIGSHSDVSKNGFCLGVKDESPYNQETIQWLQSFLTYRDENIAVLKSNKENNEKISIDSVNRNNNDNQNEYKNISLLNKSFWTGRKILLAADYGTGKNLLTIELARLALEKN
jgi:hypothetical protein